MLLFPNKPHGRLYSIKPAETYSRTLESYTITTLYTVQYWQVCVSVQSTGRVCVNVQYDSCAWQWPFVASAPESLIMSLCAFGPVRRTLAADTSSVSPVWERSSLNNPLTLRSFACNSSNNQCNYWTTPEAAKVVMGEMERVGGKKKRKQRPEVSTALP